MIQAIYILHVQILLVEVSSLAGEQFQFCLSLFKTFIYYIQCRRIIKRLYLLFYSIALRTLQLSALYMVFPLKFPASCSLTCIVHVYGGPSSLFPWLLYSLPGYDPRWYARRTQTWTRIPSHTWHTRGPVVHYRPGLLTSHRSDSLQPGSTHHMYAYTWLERRDNII